MRSIEKTNYSKIAIKNKIKFVELFRFSRFLFIITKDEKCEEKIHHLVKVLDAKKVQKTELEHRHTNKAFQYTITLR